MLEWLHSLLPQLPHFGYVLVFIVVLLNNLGLPVPGETFAMAAGFVLGRSGDSLWQAMVACAAACFIGGTCAFWAGRGLSESRLEKIRWLHLTRERLKWPEKFFKRHGSKAVFIARFIPLFPPVAANLLAGMAKMRWRIFLLYNLAGSAAYTVVYILVGYYFGRQWKQLEAWLGPAALYSISAGIVLVILCVVFRNSVTALWGRLFSGRRR
jgi:membrane protein DedA with SNARE-associated domain